MIASEGERKFRAGERQRPREPLRICPRNLLEVLLEMLCVDRPLIHLYDVSIAVDQKGSGQPHIAMTIEKLPIKNVVDGGNVFRTGDDGECQTCIAKRFGAVRLRRLLRAAGCDGMINVDGEQLQALRRPARMI